MLGYTDSQASEDWQLKIDEGKKKEKADQAREEEWHWEAAGKVSGVGIKNEASCVSISQIFFCVFNELVTLPLKSETQQERLAGIRCNLFQKRGKNKSLEGAFNFH